VFWVLAAILAARPAAFTGRWWDLQLGQSAMGEPAGIRRSIVWAVHVIGRQPVALDLLFIALQGAVGFLLIAGRRERLAIAVSVPLAVGIWWVGEGLGALPTGFASFPAGAPGAVLLYPLLCALAWPTPGEDARSTIGVRPALLLWAVLWAGEALLLVPWRFPPGQVLGASVEEANSGPSWMAGPVAQVGRFLSAHGPDVAIGLVVVTAAVGLAVFAPRTRRLSLVVGCALLAGFWVLFEGAGGLVTGQSTDVNTAPLVAVLALATWPAPYEGRRWRLHGIRWA
jgi:hypothetical protein